MLKILVRKQIAETFRGFIYDTKKGKARSKKSKIGQIVLYGFIMVGILGGMFTGLSLKLAQPLASVGMDWLYFVLFGILGLLLGVFASVFNSYSSMYRAKDNELLLSMPIKAKDILLSRLVNVFFLGAIYSIVVMLPAVVMYWIKVKLSLATFLGGIDFIIVIDLIALVLSCIFGWLIAKLSTKLKNKSFITLALSLIFLALYFLVINKINIYINYLVSNAAAVGMKVKTGAYFVYLFGKIGTGDAMAMLVFTLLSVAITAITVAILSKGFIKMVTTPEAQKKHKYKEGTAKQNSAFRAALGKEFKRFTSSTGYMMNCGLGTIIMLVFGIIILLKGNQFISQIASMLGDRATAMVVIGSCMLCMIITMNDMVAPSISLEGKSLWIYKSLPISGETVVFAKITMQLLLTLAPALFMSICMAMILPASTTEKIMLVALPLAFAVMFSLANMIVALKNPNFAWTNELVPIKQSLPVMLAILGGWAYSIVMGSIFMFAGWKLGVTTYMGILIGFTVIIAIELFIYLKKNANRIFASL